VALFGALVALVSLGGAPAHAEHEPLGVDAAAGTPADEEAVGELVRAA
jgi:hypothetical protein